MDYYRFVLILRPGTYFACMMHSRNFANNHAINSATQTFIIITISPKTKSSQNVLEMLNIQTMIHLQRQLR